MAVAKAMRHQLQESTPATSSKTTIGHYGWAIDPFRDGMFYRFGWIICAKHTRCRHEKYRGTIWHEIVFPAAEVDILGLVVLPDVQLEAGTPRFYDFNLEFETIPQGGSPPPPTPRGVRGNSLQARRQVGSLVTSCAPPPAGAEALGNLSVLMPPAHELTQRTFLVLIGSRFESSCT